MTDDESDNYLADSHPMVCGFDVFDCINSDGEGEAVFDP